MHSRKKKNFNLNLMPLIHEGTRENLFALWFMGCNKRRSPMLAKRLNVVKIQLVKDHSVDWEHEQRFISAEQVAEAATLLFDGTDREIFAVFMLDGKNRIVSYNLVSLGSLNQSIVHPRETFKAAILANAAAVIMVHNHPSGDTTPSTEDTELTRRMIQAGEVLGIKVLDHIIISTNGMPHFFSYATYGML